MSKFKIFLRCHPFHKKYLKSQADIDCSTCMSKINTIVLKKRMSQQWYINWCKQTYYFSVLCTTACPLYMCRRSRLERSPRMRKVWCSTLGRSRPRLLKHEVTKPLLNARQQVWVSLVIGDYHINGCAVSQ